MGGISIAKKIALCIFLVFTTLGAIPFPVRISQIPTRRLRHDHPHVPRRLETRRDRHEARHRPPNRLQQTPGSGYYVTEIYGEVINHSSSLETR